MSLPITFYILSHKILKKKIHTYSFVHSLGCLLFKRNYYIFKINALFTFKLKHISLHNTLYSSASTQCSTV